MTVLSLTGGLLLGLSMSLHCAGMCGGIGSAVVLSCGPGGSRLRQPAALMIAQTGKTLGYMIAGAAVGALGSSIYGLMDRHGAYQALQWTGAAVLVWTGLSQLRLIPSPAVLDRYFGPVRRHLWTLAKAARGSTLLGGVMWGLMPCGMVYSALLLAMAMGDALGGAQVMLGFGLGVMPSVTLAALGLAWAPGLAGGAAIRKGSGILLIAFALASLIWPAAAGSACSGL